MKRALCVVFCLAAGCLASGERTPLRMLPDDTPPLPYADLLTRARAQVTAATNASLDYDWTELEHSAQLLDQTAKLLANPKTVLEVPPKQKDTLAVLAGDLGKEADNLREAAKAKDAEKTKASLPRIQEAVRKLRID